MDVGWDIINGPGLTRPQADRDYLRLDGQNQPSRDIYWNNQQLKDLADPTDEQDAVNLRTLRNSAVVIKWEVEQPGHPFVPFGNIQTGFFNEATNLYEQAIASQGNFAQFLCAQDQFQPPEKFWVYRLGFFPELAIAAPIGTIFYADFGSSFVTITRPSGGQTVQMVGQVLDNPGFYVNPGPILPS